MIEANRESDAKVFRALYRGGEARTVWQQKRHMKIPFWRCRLEKGKGSWLALPHLTTNIDHLKALTETLGIALSSDDPLEACKDIMQRAEAGLLCFQ